MKLPDGGHEISATRLTVSRRVTRWGPLPGLAERCQPLTQPAPGRGHVKSAEEIMEILAAYDLTGSLRDAAELAGCSHHTVARYVAAREQGRAVPAGPARRASVTDPFLAKLEELAD